MIESLYIMNGRSGDVIIEKHWRGSAGKPLAAQFWEEVQSCTKPEDVPPVIPSGRVHLFNTYRDGLFFLVSVAGELPALFVAEFLHRVQDVLLLYLGTLNERTITRNFSTTVQLLDEMMDSGFPVVTEPNMLVSLIKPPSVGSRLTQFLTGRAAGVKDQMDRGLTSITPWRRADVSYMQNEVFFDIVEEIDCIIEPNGTMAKSDVRGSIMCTSRLSGIPDLTLLLTDPSIIQSASFHPCVRISRFERDRVVSFVPPDGEFQLLKYTVADRDLATPLSVRPDVSFRDGRGRVKFRISPRAMARRMASMSGGMGSAAAAGGAGIAPLQKIQLTVHYPSCVKHVEFNAEAGKAAFVASSNQVVWDLGRLPSDGPPSVELSTSYTLAPGETKEPLERVYATLSFVLPDQTVTGLGVRDLHLGRETYQMFKGAKAVLKTGRYEVRA